MPVPLRGSELANDFLTELHATRKGDEAGLVSMQLEGQCPEESSIVFCILESMIDAKMRQVDAKVVIDSRYVDTMTRIGNRDFPDWAPLVSARDRAERRENQARTGDWLRRLDNYKVLERREPHHAERGYVPHLRQIGSSHIGQAFATRHMKGAYVAHTHGGHYRMAVYDQLDRF